MRSLTDIVQPMQHDTQGRLPLLMWNCPLASGDRLFAMRRTGSLQEAARELAERGYVPMVSMGWNWTPAGALALARTLDEAGLPVHLLIPQADLIESWAWRDTDAFSEGPDNSQDGKLRQWPCLPLAKTEPGAEYIRSLLQPYVDAGIDVQAVWYDDEALPHPWNGIYESQQRSRAARQHYPPGVLDSRDAFRRYVFDLRARLISDMLVRPVHDLYPQALVGNYSGVRGSEAYPIKTVTGHALPPVPLGDLNVQMPAAYAMPSRLPESDSQLAQPAADDYYLRDLLEKISVAAANMKQGETLVPYVSRLVVTGNGPTGPDMSSTAFRELVRHSLLRGADSFVVFNLGFRGRADAVSPALSFAMLEDVRFAYDELLAYRQFLDEGEPVHFDVPMQAGEPIWSALRRGDEYLLRVWPGKTEGETRLYEIPLEKDHLLKLELAEAATFVVRRDGRVERMSGYDGS